MVLVLKLEIMVSSDERLRSHARVSLAKEIDKIAASSKFQNCMRDDEAARLGRAKPRLLTRTASGSSSSGPPTARRQV
ncbi:hypothetical protein ACLOJK_040072 [Asimina triloba]